MSVSDNIPWQELALTAAECAELWGITPEHILITRKPATWKASEVVEWRNRNRAGRR